MTDMVSDAQTDAPERPTGRNETPAQPMTVHVAALEPDHGPSRFLAVAVALAIGAAGGAAGWAAIDSDRSATQEAVDAAAAVVTVEAERRDLQTFIDYEATLGFSVFADVTSRLDGTVTEISEAGTELARGDVAYRIDEEPVVILFGALPSWRDLDAEAEDGSDIQQLETNLWALGYTTDLDDGNGPYLTIDGNYDWATAYAVEQWKTDLGIADPDGTFERFRAHYLAGEVRVDEPVELGATARAGVSVFTATVTTAIADVVDPKAGTVSQQRSPTELVLLEVDIAEQGNFAVGTQVEVVLADGRAATGVVSVVGEVARRSAPGGTSLIDVTVEVTDVPEGGLLEGPVTVRLIDEQVIGAAAVPVRALVALTEGGYAVEISSGGVETLVGVVTGLFADGWVEVTGVEPGDQVVVPS